MFILSLYITYLIIEVSSKLSNKLKISGPR